jgi:hypothetical protein
MALVDKKIVGASFPNEVKVVRVTYDFAVDGGAIKDYDVLEADSDCIVKLLGAHAISAVTSADAVNIDLGKGDGGVEFLSNALKATFAENLVNTGTGAAVFLASGEKVVMGVEGFTITAGKIEFIFEVVKAN